MATVADTTIQVLNHLLVLCEDGEKGYKLAAEKEKTGALKTLYEQYSAQRTRFITELKQHIRLLGQDPDKNGTLRGAAHREWINVRAAVTSDNTKSIASECERGEDAAVHAYEDALKQGLPGDIVDLLERQYAEIKTAHDRVRDIRDTAAA